MASFNVKISFNGRDFSILFGQNGTVGNLKTLFQLQSGVPAREIELSFKNRVLLDTETLSGAGFLQNDVLIAQRGQTIGQNTPSSQPSQSDLLRQALANGTSRALQNPQSSQPSQPSLFPTAPIVQPTPQRRADASRNTPLSQNTLPNTDVLRQVLRNIGGQGGQQQQQQPRNRRVTIPDPEVFRSEILADPDSLTQLLHNDPMLAEAVLADDRTMLIAILEERTRANMEKEEAENRRIDELNKDPYSAAAQAEIEKRIHDENVGKNYADAVEHIPESFGRVVMLYIPCLVNGIPCQAFVDSGAQSTIMSVEFATKCNIMRLVDTRFAGMAQGVGTAPIVGRVHLAQIKIGTQFYPFSITVIDGKKGVEFLLGLDMLRRHQCMIDLRQDGLQVGGELVKFLSEGEIDEMKHERESNAMEMDGQKQPELKIDNSEHTFPEADIEELVELGYGREQVLEALIVSNGNKEAAALFLIENPMK
jgi:DNA damage-inducible protein 1